MLQGLKSETDSLPVQVAAGSLASTANSTGVLIWSVYVDGPTVYVFVRVVVTGTTSPSSTYSGAIPAEYCPTHQTHELALLSSTSNYYIQIEPNGQIQANRRVFASSGGFNSNLNFTGNEDLSVSFKYPLK